MENYEEYRKLREFVKTLDVGNIILAHEMSKPLGLEKQIIHDVMCLLNSSKLIPYLSEKFIESFLYKIETERKYLEKYKKMDMETLGLHFLENGYVIDLNCYDVESIDENNLKNRVWKLKCQKVIGNIKNKDILKYVNKTE